MLLARIVLVAAGVTFLAVGVGFLFWPQELSETLGLTLATPMAVADVRAVYGGLDLAVAILLLLSVLRNELLLGLRIQAVVFGGLLAGRLLGQILDRPQDDLAWTMVAVESAGLLIALAARRGLTASTES